MAKVSISKKAKFVNDFPSCPTFYALPVSGGERTYSSFWNTRDMVSMSPVPLVSMGT